MHINWRDVLECAAEAYLEASMRCGDIFQLFSTGMVMVDLRVWLFDFQVTCLKLVDSW